MHPGGPCQRSSQRGTPSGLPADESDGAKRMVVLLASVDDSDAVDARLELAAHYETSSSPRLPLPVLLPSVSDPATMPTAPGPSWSPRTFPS